MLCEPRKAHPAWQLKHYMSCPDSTKFHVSLRLKKPTVSMVVAFKKASFRYVHAIRYQSFAASSKSEMEVAAL